MAAAAIGMAAAQGGSNMISSLGTAGIQMAGASMMQDKQMSFTREMADRVEGTFTSGGLPKFMAYQGGSSMNNWPVNMFQTAGQNFQVGGPVNANLPVYTTPFSQYSGMSKPRENTNVGNQDPQVGAAQRNYYDRNAYWTRNQGPGDFLQWNQPAERPTPTRQYNVGQMLVNPNRFFPNIPRPGRFTWINA